MNESQWISAFPVDTPSFTTLSSGMFSRGLTENQGQNEPHQSPDTQAGLPGVSDSLELHLHDRGRQASIWGSCLDGKKVKKRRFPIWHRIRKDSPLNLHFHFTLKTGSNARKKRIKGYFNEKFHLLTSTSVFKAANKVLASARSLITYVQICKTSTKAKPVLHQSSKQIIK